jgi:hypothetical protein
MGTVGKWLWIVFFVGLVTGAAYGENRAKLTLKLVDDDGLALTNMPVVAGFYYSSKFSGKTDTNGLFVMDGNAKIGEANYFVQADGYYRSQGRYTYTGEVKNGCSQPWNPLATMLVRRIVNPVAMYAKRVEAELPLLDQPVGYDLIKGDWVAPCGGGIIADITVELKKRVADKFDFDSSICISFPNLGDGMLETSRRPFNDSSFKLPRLAPDKGYAMTNFIASYSSTNYFRPDENMSYFFRIRTQTNLEGNVISALYGKIPFYIGFAVRRYKTGVMLFPYCLNPTPNDRNMEFDPAKNLFKNLKSTEQVVEP